MEDNYMATTRNGHELKDMYNPETNTLDIRSNGLYPLQCAQQHVQQRIPFRRNGMWQYGGVPAIL